MDCLTFISELVKNLAWPLVVFSTIFLFKDQVSTLLGLIMKIKYKDLEIELGKKKLEEMQPDARVDLRKIPKTKEEKEVAALFNLAMNSPVGAILAAWNRVEAASLKRFERYKMEFSSPPQIGGLLELTGLFKSAVTNDLFYELEHIRNLAVHGREKSLIPKDAIRFIELSNRLIEAINRK